MDKKEALEWMSGYRDMGNLTQQTPLETFNIRVEQANAAKMNQAYWFLRAYKEGLIIDTVKLATKIHEQVHYGASISDVVQLIQSGAA